MCRFNQHRLLDLQFRRETLPPLFASCLELSPWPCHAPPPVSGIHPSGGPISPPTCVISFRDCVWILMSDLPVTPTRTAPTPVNGRAEKAKKKSVFSAPILGETWGEGAGWWLSNGLNICTCDAKCVAERDGICRTSALSCADEDPPPAAPKHPASLTPFTASHPLPPVFIKHFCVINVPFFFSFYKSPFFLSRALCADIPRKSSSLRWLHPLLSGWRDYVPPSVFLVGFLMLSVCSTPPPPQLSLSLRWGTRDEDAHFSLPWRARLQCCAINQKLSSCLGSLLTYFICVRGSLSPHTAHNSIAFRIFPRRGVHATSYDNLFG